MTWLFRASGFIRCKLNGFWSVTVRANWRIVFRFEEGDARAVDLIDYH